jgi:hypothetical protein
MYHQKLFPLFTFVVAILLFSLALPGKLRTFSHLIAMSTAEWEALQPLKEHFKDAFKDYLYS